MTYRIDSMTTLKKPIVDKLKEHNLETFEQLHPYFDDTTKQNELVRKLGVDEKDVRPLFCMTDLLRIKSIDPKYVEMFVHSGVDSVEKFTSLTPERVVKMVTEWKDSKNITLPTPTPMALTGWMKDAKELETVGSPR